MKYRIGIDVSKDELDFGVVNEKLEMIYHLETANSLKGIRLFVKEAKLAGIDAKDCIWGMENTGIYMSSVLSFVTKQKIVISVVNGNEIKNSLGIQRGKDDKVDSFRIAEYLMRFGDKLRFWEPPRAVVQKIKDLMSLRERSQKAINMLQVPINEARSAQSNQTTSILEKHSRRAIKELKKTVKKVDEQINHLIKKDEGLKQMKKYATSVKGIGRINFLWMVVYTDEFKNFANAKKFAAYAGVAPYKNRSGKSTWKKDRVSKQSNRHMNAKLTMAARSAIRSDGEIKQYYERKLKEGKIKRQVINAVKNKLIARVFACIRNQRMYQNKYTHMLA